MVVLVEGLSELTAISAGNSVVAIDERAGMVTAVA